MASKTELSDESLWKLFEVSTNDPLSQSVIDKTQAAAEAIIHQKSKSISSSLAGLAVPSETTPIEPFTNTSVFMENPPAQVPSEAASDVNEESFIPHELDTVLEESSRESLPLPVNTVKVKVKNIREIISPFDGMQPAESLSGETAPRALSTELPVSHAASETEKPTSPQQTGTHGYRSYSPPIKHLSPRAEQVQFTGSVPGGLFVTVEKHTLDGATAAKHVTSTPRAASQSVKAVQPDIIHTVQPTASTCTRELENKDISSSSCQSSFDIPKLQSVDESVPSTLSDELTATIRSTERNDDEANRVVTDTATTSGVVTGPATTARIVTSTTIASGAVTDDVSTSRVVTTTATTSTVMTDPGITGRVVTSTAASNRVVTSTENKAMRGGVSQGRGRAILSNPQLMGQDVQVKQFDQGARQAAVKHISAKQSDYKVRKNKYTVPVKRVDNSHDLRREDISTKTSQVSAGNGLVLPNQNITVQHELVTSDFVTSLMERLIGQTTTSQTSRESKAELQEIKSLEDKLQATEVELSVIKQQMSRQQFDDQNKLLAELVHSQRNMQHQLVSMGSLEHGKSKQGGAMVSDPLKTPAPRSKHPTAVAPDESPPGGFMEQVVRSYPSPMSPQKAHDRQKYRLSPEPILKRPSPLPSPNRVQIVDPKTGRAARQRRKEEMVQREELQAETEHKLHLLQGKVDKLLDERRMESLQVEQGLKRAAPIDRYLNDIESITKANKHFPLGDLVKPQAKHGKDMRKGKGDELDVTFIQEESETITLAEQMKERLNKLNTRKQQSEENMATVLALRAREQAYLNPDDDASTEEQRLHKLIKANLDRAEAEVQKQVCQIDFLPKPLHDHNVASAPQTGRYKSAAQRLKAVQAKVDTGIARKPRIPLDKENEPIDLYRDDNYIRRVYGKALYHSQRRTLERAKPDSPTRPVPFKKTTGHTVKSEKSQTRADKSKTMAQVVKPSQQKKPSNQTAALTSSKKTIPKSTGVSQAQSLTPTTVLGSGMRVEQGDPTKMVFEVLPLSQSEIRPSGEPSSANRPSGGSNRPSGGSNRNKVVDGDSDSSNAGKGSTKMSAITVDKVPSPVFSSASVEGRGGNTNNNAQSDRESRISSGQESKGHKSDNSNTSEWQESVDESTNQQPPLMMTADSLDLSAVTPVAGQTKKSSSKPGQGQTHSTPIEDGDGQQKCTGSNQPPPRAWEEFANDPLQKMSLDEDRSRSDDIVTPPTVLPGYQYRQDEQVPAAQVLQTPVARYQDLFNVGGKPQRVGRSRPQEVVGASRYPPEQWNVDPVAERPLYDPTEMATRDWLEQRLMSKCIERMIREYPLRKPQPNVDPTSGRGEDNSPHGSVDNTLIAGAMGEGGVAQVYIDAGRPINTGQVRDVMRQCLAEKIRTVLGTREMLDRTPGDVMNPQPSGQSDGAKEDISQPQPRDTAEEPKAAALFQPVSTERVKTPERTPPTTPPVESSKSKPLALTPEPSPPSTPALEASFSRDFGKESDVLHSRSVQPRHRLGGDTAASRMPSTPFDLHLQQSRHEEDEVKIQEEAISPSPAPSGLPAAPDVVEGSKGQGEEKLHLSQVSLWDTLSAGQTQESVLDEEPPFEMRYSIETPEPTPPSSPPQAVSVQTSLTERGLQAKLAASLAESERGRRSESVATSYDVSRNLDVSRPQTPQRPPSVAKPEVKQVVPAQLEDIEAPVIQSEGDITTSTVTDTQMNTVSEGEWILKSDGQLTPKGEGTLADLSLASSSDDDSSTGDRAPSAYGRARAAPANSSNRATTVVHVKGKDGEGEVAEEQSHSEGEVIGLPHTNPIVMLLSRLKETPKALKSAPAKEDGEYIIVSSRQASGGPKDKSAAATDVDHTLHMSDLEQSANVKAKRQILNNVHVESNKSSSSSGGFAFADSKQVTVRPHQLHQAVSSHGGSADQPITVSHSPQTANRMAPNRSTKGSPTKRPIPGMIQSTLDSNRKSRPTSSLRTTVDYSQMSNTFSQTRGSVDSPDRMHTETLLKSGGYLTNTFGDTTSELSAQRRPETTTLNTQQLLARTIDTQGLSTGTSTALLDTNKLLADTLEPQQSVGWRSEVRDTRDLTGTGVYNVTESLDSVSSGGILRSSNDYTRTLTGTPSANKPRQYLRFSVPTGDDVSQSSDNISELEF